MVPQSAATSKEEGAKHARLGRVRNPPGLLIIAPLFSVSVPFVAVDVAPPPRRPKAFDWVPKCSLAEHFRAGFPGIPGRHRPRDPFRSPGLARNINLHEKSAPQTISKAMSWHPKVPPDCLQVPSLRRSSCKCSFDALFFLGGGCRTPDLYFILHGAPISFGKASSYQGAAYCL